MRLPWRSVFHGRALPILPVGEASAERVAPAALGPCRGDKESIQLVKRMVARGRNSTVQRPGPASRQQGLRKPPFLELQIPTPSMRGNSRLQVGCSAAGSPEAAREDVAQDFFDSSGCQIRDSGELYSGEMHGESRLLNPDFQREDQHRQRSQPAKLDEATGHSRSTRTGLPLYARQAVVVFSLRCNIDQRACI